MNKSLMLVKREIWENQGAFVRAPLIAIAVIVGAILLSMIIGSRFIDWQQYSDVVGMYNDATSYEQGASQHPSTPTTPDNHRTFNYSDKVIGQVESSHHAQGFKSPESDSEFSEMMRFLYFGPYILFGFFIWFLQHHYGLSCLFDDRKDGSILFWKSMPVSEWHTILIKFAVVVVLLTVAALLAAFTLSIAVFILMVLMALASGVNGAAGAVIDSQYLLPALFQYAGAYTAITMLMLPVLAWVFFVSSVAKRNPLLFAITPVVALVIIENLIFNSAHFLGWLIRCWTGRLPNDPSIFILEPNWWQVYHVAVSGQFWFGVLISGLLLYGAVWFRTYRFERL